MSNYFDRLFGDPKVIETIIFILSKEYKLNFTEFANCVEEMKYINPKLKDMIEESRKEMIDFANQRKKK